MKQLFFGFRCPHCTQRSVIPFDGTDRVFSAAGSCGHCAVIAEPYGEKLAITVPCVTCSMPHRYTVSRSMLSREGGLVLSCAYSGVDCFFAGTREEVEGAMEASDEEILRVLSLEEKVRGEDTVEKTLGLEENKGMVIDSAGSDQVAFFHPEIASDMLFLIKDMAYDQKIGCVCGRKDIDIRVASEEIVFSCPACHRSLALATRSVSDRARLEEMSEILLKDIQ